MLELVCPAEAEVAIFSVALDTGMFIYLIAYAVSVSLLTTTLAFVAYRYLTTH